MVEREIDVKASLQETKHYLQTLIEQRCLLHSQVSELSERLKKPPKKVRDFFFFLFFREKLLALVGDSYSTTRIGTNKAVSCWSISVLLEVVASFKLLADDWLAGTCFQ